MKYFKPFFFLLRFSLDDDGSRNSKLQRLEILEQDRVETRRESYYSPVVFLLSSSSCSAPANLTHFNSQNLEGYCSQL